MGEETFSADFDDSEMSLWFSSVDVEGLNFEFWQPFGHLEFLGIDFKFCRRLAMVLITCAPEIDFCKVAVQFVSSHLAMPESVGGNFFLYRNFGTDKWPDVQPN